MSFIISIVYSTIISSYFTIENQPDRPDEPDWEPFHLISPIQVNKTYQSPSLMIQNPQPSIESTPTPTTVFEWSPTLSSQLAGQLASQLASQSASQPASRPIQQSGRRNRLNDEDKLLILQYTVEYKQTYIDQGKIRYYSLIA